MFGKELLEAIQESIESCFVLFCFSFWFCFVCLFVCFSEVLKVLVRV